ncbi:hypothetical protein BV389_19170 [Escherichia coli]|nr:hypothetical protein BV389_19170 [Escherichia coli]
MNMILELYHLVERDVIIMNLIKIRFFVNQILDKDDEQHSVHIRSNEFSINIDGSLVKQPY